MPAISVIVPVYKVEKYIHRCVDSILGQTFRDFELILVDDGSPDNCGAICDEYAAKDSRVVVIHQENGGLSAARNAGIDWAFAHSDSQWISFIDSDDWVHPEYLERLLAAAVDNGVSVSICAYVQTDGREPEIDPETLVPALWDTEEFYVAHNVNATIACGKLYRRECFETIRYPLGKLHEDEFTTYKILFRFPTVAVIHAPLYFYYTNPESIMQSQWSSSRHVAYDALEEQIEFFLICGYRNAMRSIIRRYLKSIADKLEYVRSTETVNQFVLLDLKRRKKQHFHIYAEKLDINDERDAWVLTQVFPVKMNVYWYMLAAWKHIKGFFGRDNDYA